MKQIEKRLYEEVRKYKQVAYRHVPVYSPGRAGLWLLPWEILLFVSQNEQFDDELTFLLDWWSN